MTPLRSRWLLPLGLLALVTGGLMVHLASSDPDGLESVAERQGFAGREAPIAGAPVPDYELPFWRTPVGKSLVGLGGTLLTFGLLYGLGHLLRRRPREEGASPARPGLPGPPAKDNAPPSSGSTPPSLS